MLTTQNMPTQASVQSQTQTVRWSDAQNWLGRTPASGENIVIPEGLTVILDESTPELGTLMVRGKLIFDDKDLTLTADNVMVAGELWVGSEEKPFAYDANIVLTGKEADPDLMMMNGNTVDNKALMVSGRLELHGAEVNSWTQLDGTLQAGSTSLRLAEDVKGWNVGDRIAIAPTDFDPFEVEEVTITGINGRNVSFSQPLKYLHYGQQETLPDGRQLDMRAEVTNLSRNITISGRDEGEVYTSGSGETLQRWGYGGHTMYMPGSEIRIDGVEFEGLGISGKIGRYPIHFHLGGDREGSYVKNSAIHHTMQRGIVVHQSEKLLIEGNTVFDTTGHQYYLEDGVEVDNKFYNNLGMLPRTTPQDVRIDLEVKAADGEDPLKRRDRASSFWITNGANEFVGNHAVAVPRGTGFWFTNPDVNTRARGINPYDERTQRPTLAFDDNTAHTVAFEQKGGSNLGYGPEWSGLGIDIENIRASYNGRYKGVPNAPINNFTAYKTGNIALNAGSFSSEIVNPILAESRVLLHVPQGQNGEPAKVINPALIGRTDNNPAGRDVEQYIQGLIKTGGFAGPIAAEPIGSRGFDVIGGFLSDREDFQSLLGTKEKHFSKVSFLPDSTGTTALDFDDTQSPSTPPVVEPPVVEPPIVEPPVTPPVVEPPVTPPVVEPPVIEPPVTPVIEPPVVEPPVYPQDGEPIKLIASGNFLNGQTGAQQWNEDVAVLAQSADGQAAIVNFGWDGLAVKGDRYNNQIDYNLASNTSEQLILNFKTAITQASVELGRMSLNEWQGLNETGRWTAFDTDGAQVATGQLDPGQARSLGSSNFAFDIATPRPFSRIELAATAYGNGANATRPDNNSDFNLRSLTYTSASVATVQEPETPPSPPITPAPPVPPVVQPPQPPTPPVVTPEPTPPPSLTFPPVTLTASKDFLDGSTSAQSWGDGVSITAYSTQNTAAKVKYGFGGLAVKGDRYNDQIDYDAATNTSERLELNFNGSVTAAQIELGRMAISEWENLPETGIWTAYNASGDPIATGELDPRNATQTGSDSYQFKIEAAIAFDKLVVEASAYGNGIGTSKTGNNSDFNLRNVTYTRIESGTTPPQRPAYTPPVSPPVEPPEVVPPGTTPAEPTVPTAAISPVGDLVTLTASSNVLNGSEDTQFWGEGVLISGVDFDGSAAQVVYDTQFDDKGFGVAGTDDRWNQIDFYQNKGNQSEQLRLDFDGSVDDLTITVGMLGKGEGNPYDETGKWTALDASGAVTGSGFISPDQSLLGAGQKESDSYGKYPIAIDATGPVSALVIEATGFGQGQGQPISRNYGENNSDFNLVEISFNPVLAQANAAGF